MRAKARERRRRGPDSPKVKNDVQGTPSTALIDAQGRIVFRPEVHDTASRIVLEHQVEALLGRAATDR